MTDSLGGAVPTSCAVHRCRVALFGPYASRNLGDTATQMSVMQNLRSRCLNVSFLGVSPDPGDTNRSLGIPAFPLSGFGAIAGDLGGDFLERGKPLQKRAISFRAIRRISSFVSSVDLLVISGGGQIDDFWGGAWAHPWSMLLWTIIAKWQRVPVVFLAVGLDKLDAALSRRFCVWAIEFSAACSFRDAQTYRTMRKLGVEKPTIVCPDVVFALDFVATPSDASSNPFVVLSPISRNTWSSTETNSHSTYLEGLIAVGVHLSRQGYDIRIVCSQTTMDTADAMRLLKSLQDMGVSHVTYCEAPLVEDFLRHVNGAELVIASRLHAVILSLIAGAPVVALAHLGKVGAAMQAMDLEEFCLSLQAFPLDRLFTLADLALSRKDSLREQIRASNLRLRSELVPVFDSLAALHPIGKA